VSVLESVSVGVSVSVLDKRLAGSGRTQKSATRSREPLTDSDTETSTDSDTETSTRAGASPSSYS
jgi:hypothetical protein